MKKILLMTTKYGEGPDNRWLTNELCIELKREGYDVYALVLSWLENEEHSYREEEGIKVLRYKLPNCFYKKNIISKILKMLLFPFLIRSAIKKQFKKIKFDLVISNTPCMTLNGLTKYFKKRDNAYNYLILWDFFPYYLLDLGVLKKNFKFNLLRRIEKKMFFTYDKIGCMTKKNIEFLKSNYDYTKENIEILPLWAEIKPEKFIDKKKIREKYGFLETDKILIYGGAMSIVQKLENILNLAERLKEEKEVKFIFIGKGTEVSKIKNLIKSKELDNVIFLDYIPREEYEDLVSMCDIGIVSLSEKLSVPSFPSKTIDYCKIGLPILAAIDGYTDYGQILEKEIKAGKASVSNDIDNLFKKAKEMLENKDLRVELGKNGRKYYEENFDVRNVAKIIIKNLESQEK